MVIGWSDASALRRRDELEKEQTVRVATTVVLPGPPEVVWPLLCSSTMDDRVRCGFRLGIPKPVECRLPAGVGGVGADRQCVSDRGHINQRISRWDPPHALRFHMVDTNLYFRPSVSSLEDEFELVAVGESATRITRTTTIGVTGPGRWLKGAFMCAGLKVIHRYVFDNWARSVARTSELP